MLPELVENEGDLEVDAGTEPFPPVAVLPPRAITQTHAESTLNIEPTVTTTSYCIAS